MAGYSNPLERDVQQLVIEIFYVFGIIPFRLLVRFRHPHDLSKTQPVGIHVPSLLLAHLPVFLYGVRGSLISEIAEKAVTVIVLRSVMERAGAAGTGNPNG